MKGKIMERKTKTCSFIFILLSLGVVVCLTTTIRTAKISAAGGLQATGELAKHSAYSDWHTIHSATKATARSQGAAAEQTVEQTRKNIQILKGLSEAQLFLVMNFVASSLGVQCNFCHVQRGRDPKTGQTDWVWGSDDKPEKQTARRMMQMVLSIKANNTVDFRENEVTCYTCHRGQRKPVGLPAMPLAKSGHEGPSDAPSNANPNPPTVESIFGKYLEAVGGNAATSTKTLVLEGKREASQDRNWPNEITLAVPDKILIVATMPQATVRQIVNGENGWIVNGGNVRKLAPAEALAAKRGWDELFNVIKVRPSQGMRFGGLQKVGEREAYVVERETDATRELYSFDSQTGLLLRKMTVNKTMLMPFPEQIDFEDYRDVDGVKVPFIIRYSAIDTYDSWTRTFTEIKRNVIVEDKLFAMPAEGSTTTSTF